MLKSVRVTRVLKSTKVFEVEVKDDDPFNYEFEDAAIEQACEAEVITEGVDGWTEDLDWEAEVL